MVERLLVLKKAEDLAIFVYQATLTFSKSEMFGLVSQMRRAAVSVGANITEGAARNYKKEYIQFLQVALGSLRELEFYIGLSFRLGFLNQSTHRSLEAKAGEVGKMLYGLIKSLHKTTAPKKLTSTR
jgi:four helix bundle protein